MKQIKVNSVAVFDNNREKSDILLGNATVIFGPSNTGKSLVLGYISQAFGSKTKKIFPEGFNDVELECSCDNQSITICRDLDRKIFTWNNTTSDEQV